MEEKYPYKRKSKIDEQSKEELIEIVNSVSGWNELSRALGYKSGSAGGIRVIKSRLQFQDISTDHFTSLPINSLVKKPSEVFVEDASVSWTTVKKKYKEGHQTEQKCSICGLEPFWNGKELTLILDHINGNHFDHRIENLRWVCPNCDHQLPTFAGRNHD